MSADVCWSRVLSTETRKLSDISAFLLTNGLLRDADIDIFITLTRNNKLIACGGLAGNIIKCVAIDESLRGEGIALKLATELINLAYERHQTHLFLYSKCTNEFLFKPCGFYPVAHIPGMMVLMENSAIRFKRYINDLATLRQNGRTIGSIVMNANPFTCGHRYLIEQAAAQCDWLHLFLVREESAVFSWQTRLDLLCKGTADIKKLTIHHGSAYLISRATFPGYFLKDRGIIDSSHCEIDLRIFRQHIAPALGITHRFVGSEPFCPLTARYNAAMRHWLDTPALPAPPVMLMEIERLCYQDSPISASQVRQLFCQRAWQALIPLVPPATLDVLQHMQAHNSVQTAHALPPSELATGEQ